jgi:hypothetical protein
MVRSRMSTRPGGQRASNSALAKDGAESFVYFLGWPAPGLVVFGLPSSTLPSLRKSCVRHGHPCPVIRMRQATICFMRSKPRILRTSCGTILCHEEGYQRGVKLRHRSSRRSLKNDGAHFHPPTWHGIRSRQSAVRSLARMAAQASHFPCRGRCRAKCRGRQHGTTPVLTPLRCNCEMS